MATQVDIINLALTRLGVRTITLAELTEQSSEPARRAVVVWDLVRQAVLRDHAWGFALKNSVLTDAQGDAVPSWQYMYLYPPDCLRAWSLISATVINPQPFEKLLDGDRLVIVCNLPDAVLRYTTDVEDTALWDAVYVDAFAWRLAAELAKPLAGDDAKMRDMLQAYMMSLAQAKTSDANEGQHQSVPVGLGNPYYEVR